MSFLPPRFFPFLLAAPAALAGCLGFTELTPDSACAKSSSDLKWLDRPARLEIAEHKSRFYDRTIADRALDAGIYVQGDTRFHLQRKGRHLVEIFLMAADGGKSSFVLEANGAVVDGRNKVKTGPGRMRPKRGTRRLYLLAMIDGPAELVVRTDAPRYLLSAVRWTPEKEFEETLAPKWLERARYLVANPLFEGQEGGPSARRHYLQQLFDRLYFSSRAGLKKEAVIGLARAWYWLAAENHEPFDLDRTEQLFFEALEIAPKDPIVRQMISASCGQASVRVGAMPKGPYCDKVKPVPWMVEMPPPLRKAPEWALTQRKLARRMDTITRWWVEQRQQPNGELGGGWGDDVEILRHWGPQALGFGSRVAVRGIKRIADGLWNSGQLLNGYDRNVSDVEHSSEPTTDTQPLLAALFPNDPEVLARLKQTAACAEHWIARQPDGRHRFRGSWFNCREADPKPERAVDVHLNVRAMGPALWYAYLSRDSRLIDLLARWGDSWTEAMRRTEHGKPPGIIPSALKSADGSYLIGSDRWDRPDAEWDYFQWSGSSQAALTSLLLALHDLTGEARWLEAAGESFQVLDHCDADRSLCKEIRGAPEAFYEWRRRSGNPKYDGFFGYVAAAADSTELDLMARQAREAEQRLSFNFDMFTSEVLYTDRVYYQLPPQYRQRLFGGEAPRGERYPTFAVTWPAAEDEFARAVLDTTPTTLRLRIYSFQGKQHSVPIRAWRLKKGWYRWDTVEVAGGAAFASGEVYIARLPHTLEVEVPGQQEVAIHLKRFAD